MVASDFHDCLRCLVREIDPLSSNTLVADPVGQLGLGGPVPADYRPTRSTQAQGTKNQGISGFGVSRMTGVKLPIRG